MTEENLTIAHTWFEAFNTKDLEKLLSLYHEDAEHYSPKLRIRQPETSGLIRGKEALRSWWQDAFDRLPSLQYEILTLTANDDRVFMEYLRKVKDEEDLRVGEVLEIRGKRIVASRVYHA